MPEGDVLFRTAAVLQRWLGGREVTEASTDVAGLNATHMVGQKLESVEAWGKHLLVRFASGQVLHTHLRMSGSWHVYRTGEEWRRPQRQARLAITCGDRMAVCFNAPVVELLGPKAEHAHPALSRLGPDVLADTLDLSTIQRRARAAGPNVAIGELLLDQRVMAGIGNIYRCEALFLSSVHPWTPHADLDSEKFDEVVTTASRLMKANLGPLEGGPARRWVYRRAGRPCRRCGTLVKARGQGEQARTAYWCPTCQPPLQAGGGSAL